MSAKFPRGGGSKPILSHPSNCLKKPYGKIITCITCCSGGRGHHHFSAQHFNMGWGSRYMYANFLHRRAIFQGLDVLVPISMEHYTTCDFPVGPGLPVTSGSVLAPSLDRVWICSFVFYSLHPSQQYFRRRDGSFCVEPVLS